MKDATLDTVIDDLIKQVNDLNKRIEALEEEIKHKEGKLSHSDRNAINMNKIYGPPKSAYLPKIKYFPTKDPLAKGKTLKDSK